MEAIGTLAGGIAHDFNNLLAVILGGIELSILEVPKDSLIHTYLLEVLGATERATDLVQQILTFSRKKELERKPLQLAILCKEALKMLRASIPSTIEIQQDIDPRSGLALADPTQIHQIIMNLCSNAAQAMGEKGGVLQVTLKNTDFKGQEVFSDTVTEAGPYLELTVSDTGEGIAPAILERIFDPYFTTKKIDKGTGLGLAVVQGIIKAYQGAIRVSSNPGQGTTFQIYLPRIEDPEIVERFAQVRQLPRGTERILLVDDEESFVRLAKNILERLGYHVVATTNSLEALEVFKKGPENFDLVLTDHIMPKLTGTELARRIHWINPAIPIMIITGMGDLIPTEQKESTPVKKFIMKPLFIHSLAEKIREVLDQ
jgi:CheY-like chemotaxis protein